MSMDVCLLHLVYKVLKAFGDLRILSRIFLSNTTHLIVLLCICFRTNNFVLMCLYNVLHMYLIKLIFPDLYIGTKIKRSQLNLNMWYFFVSMLFYIFQHGLIPVSIFVLHLYFLLFRVLKCLQIFAIYKRWNFFLIVSIKQVKGCLSSHIHLGGSPP